MLGEAVDMEASGDRHGRIEQGEQDASVCGCGFNIQR